MYDSHDMLLPIKSTYTRFQPVCGFTKVALNGICFATFYKLQFDVYSILCIKRTPVARGPIYGESIDTAFSHMGHLSSHKLIRCDYIKSQMRRGSTSYISQNVFYTQIRIIGSICNQIYLNHWKFP